MRSGRFWRCAATVAMMSVALLAAGCGDHDKDDDDDGRTATSNALEFVGRINQEGPTFTGYGYVTHVDGVPATALFSSAPMSGSEKTARVTFRFRTTAVSRGINTEVFAIHSRGTIEFFRNQRPAGNFDDPASFASGQRVGRGSIDIQNIITVYAPNKGIADADGALTLDDAPAFQVGGEEATIGGEGEVLRVSLAGAGTRSDAVLPRAVINFAGRAVQGG